ncbi:hypothetical protein DZF79_15260 [Vibrio parahaemolyticus]|nr:hypothetical protein [Vibrio parahaemolyticus]
MLTTKSTIVDNKESIINELRSYMALSDQPNKAINTSSLVFAIYETVYDELPSFVKPEDHQSYMGELISVMVQEGVIKQIGEDSFVCEA